MPLSKFLVPVGLMALTAGTIAVVLFSVRCPGCRDRPIRRLFWDPNGFAAVSAFLGSRTCMRCGYDPRLTTVD